MLVKFVRDATLDEVKYKKGDTKEYPDSIARLLIDTGDVVAIANETKSPMDFGKKKSDHSG